MKVIWQHGEITVRDVYEDLLSRRQVSYTTVMTMLGVLEGKGHVEKVTGDRAYVYKPTQPKQEVIANMVTDFISRVFNGSAKPLIQHLVESNQITREEIDQIFQSSGEKRNAKLEPSETHEYDDTILRSHDAASRIME